MSPIARAIDVGYGNTKFVTLLNQESIQCGMFPSIAPQASNGPDLSGGLMQRRNTVVVDVDGVKYEVGKDARLAQDASHGRVLDPDYSMTDTHMALIRGALHRGSPGNSGSRISDISASISDGSRRPTGAESNEKTPP